MNIVGEVRRRQLERIDQRVRALMQENRLLVDTDTEKEFAECILMQNMDTPASDCLGDSGPILQSVRRAKCAKRQLLVNEYMINRLLERALSLHADRQYYSGLLLPKCAMKLYVHVFCGFAFDKLRAFFVFVGRLGGQFSNRRRFQSLEPFDVETKFVHGRGTRNAGQWLRDAKPRGAEPGELHMDRHLRKDRSLSASITNISWHRFTFWQKERIVEKVRQIDSSLVGIFEAIGELGRAFSLDFASDMDPSEIGALRTSALCAIGFSDKGIDADFEKLVHSYAAEYARPSFIGRNVDILCMAGIAMHLIVRNNDTIARYLALCFTESKQIVRGYAIQWLVVPIRSLYATIRYEEPAVLSASRFDSEKAVKWLIMCY